MPRPKKEPELKPANLTNEEIKRAIPKIERRIADLENFDVQKVMKRSDSRISSLRSSLDALLVAIFGPDTVEYKRYYYSLTNLDRAGMNLMHPTPIEEVREGLVTGIDNAKAQLETIKKLFLEELEDAGETSEGKALKAYEGLELHTSIEKAVGHLYRDGHYANAVEDAVKALNSLVRLNSGVDDKDGTSLMEFVFSPKKPILKFNEFQGQNDLDEQKGFMMLFSGAVVGLRNPRAHKIIIDNPEKALEFIAFISLLAKLCDDAKK